MKVNKISNFIERQNIDIIYAKYLDPLSENYILDIFEKLHYHNFISESELTKLSGKFDKLADEVFSRLKEFDKSQLTKK